MACWSPEVENCGSQNRQDTLVYDSGTGGKYTGIVTKLLQVCIHVSGASLEKNSSLNQCMCVHVFFYNIITYVKLGSQYMSLVPV